MSCVVSESSSVTLCWPTWISWFIVNGFRTPLAMARLSAALMNALLTVDPAEVARGIRHVPPGLLVVDLEIARPGVGQAPARARA